MNKRLTLIGFLISFCTLFNIEGQELSSLNTQKEELLKKIQQANLLLKSYDQKKSKSITQIRVYDRQIQDREKLISSTMTSPDSSLPPDRSTLNL